MAEIVYLKSAPGHMPGQEVQMANIALRWEAPKTKLEGTAPSDARGTGYMA